jgi:ketosteroid isomerase-like protein
MAEPESVKLLRQSYEAFNRGDFEAAMEHAHPEFELHRPPTGPYAGETIRGREGVLAYLEPDAFEEQRVTPLEFVEGDGVILVRLEAYGRGAGSGIEIREEAFHVWRIRDGKAYSLEVHPERDTAYQSAGLRPT